MTPQEVQDKQAENGIKWNNIISALILASILGAWATTWHNQKETNETFVLIRETMAGMGKALAIVDVKIDHNDADCTKRFKEAMRELNRLEAEFKEHVHR